MTKKTSIQIFEEKKVRSVWNEEEFECRKSLTDEWKRCGVEEGIQFATLTDIITKTWSGKTTKEYKQYKGLKKENLRDNMTNTELILNMLAETATTDLSKEHNPETLGEKKITVNFRKIDGNFRL